MEYRGKRREERPDYRYGSDQVAAIDQDQLDAGNSQRQKNDGPEWGQNSEGKRPWNGEKRPWNGEKRPWNGERKPWNGDNRQWASPNGTMPDDPSLPNSNQSN